MAAGLVRDALKPWLEREVGRPGSESPFLYQRTARTERLGLSKGLWYHTDGVIIKNASWFYTKMHNVDVCLKIQLLLAVRSFFSLSFLVFT